MPQNYHPGKYIDVELSALLAEVGLESAICPTVLPEVDVIARSLEQPPPDALVQSGAKIPRYRFACIAGPYRNAVVFKSRDQYVIGLTLELILDCYFLADYLFANQCFLPHIGEAHLESPFIGFPALNPYSSQVHSSKVRVIPKCALRARAARLLAGISLNFIVHHEVAHVRCGHVDLMVSRGCSGLSETSTVPARLIGPREAIRIAQEFEADLKSCIRIYDAIPELLAPDDELAAIFAASENRARLVAIACSAAFGLLEEREPCLTIPLLRGYPPIAVRRLATTRSILSRSVEMLPENEAAERIRAGYSTIAGGDYAVMFKIVCNVVDSAEVDKVLQTNTYWQDVVDELIDMCVTLMKKYRAQHAPYAYHF